MKNYSKKWNVSKRIELWNSYHNPLYIWWKCRKLFKFPQIKFYIGKKFWFFGFPCRNDYLNKILDIRLASLGWKSKFNSPRHEWDPYFSIVLFRKWEFLIMFGYWGKDKDNVKDLATWEAMLDYLYFNVPKEKLVDYHTWKGNDGFTTIKEFIKWK